MNTDKKPTLIHAHGNTPRRFWIVVHNTGGPHPVGFSFWRNYAIKKFLADQNSRGGAMTWRQARRSGFRVYPVFLQLARPRA